MPCTALSSTSSALRNASTIDVFCPTSASRRSFGIAISVSTAALQARDALVGLPAALLALEAERLGDDADGERAAVARDLRDDRRRAGAGAAAHAGGDEHHVGAG